MQVERLELLALGQQTEDKAEVLSLELLHLMVVVAEDHPLHLLEHLVLVEEVVLSMLILLLVMQVRQVRQVKEILAVLEILMDIHQKFRAEAVEQVLLGELETAQQV